MYDFCVVVVNNLTILCLRFCRAVFVKFVVHFFSAFIKVISVEKTYTFSYTLQSDEIDYHTASLEWRVAVT